MVYMKLYNNIKTIENQEVGQSLLWGSVFAHVLKYYRATETAELNVDYLFLMSGK